MIALQATLGFLLLMLGRQFYAVFVGGIGFLAALFVAPRLTPGISIWSLITTALIVGAVCGALTYMVKRFAAGVAAVLSGIYILALLPQVLGLESGWLHWPLTALGGVAALVLLLLSFDFTLVLLSSLLGSALLIVSINFGRINETVLFVVFIAYGLLAQFVMLQYGRSSPD